MRDRSRHFFNLSDESSLILPLDDGLRFGYAVVAGDRNRMREGKLISAMLRDFLFVLQARERLVGIDGYARMTQIREFEPIRIGGRLQPIADRRPSRRMRTKGFISGLEIRMKLKVRIQPPHPPGPVSSLSVWDTQQSRPQCGTHCLVHLGRIT